MTPHQRKKRSLIPPPIFKESVEGLKEATERAEAYILRTQIETHERWKEILNGGLLE
jgi:predicted DNA-binding protein